MTQRIIFEFLYPIDQAFEDWRQVVKVIEDAGGQYISEISGAPPYILTAVMPDELQARLILDELKKLPGIGRTDLDTLQNIVF